MSLSLTLAGAIALGAVLAPARALAGEHQKAQKPEVSWTLPHMASAAQAIGFTWTARHLGKGDSLVVQKPEGTAHTWRSIMRLEGVHGSAQLPGLALGRFRFRIADLAQAPRPPVGHRRRGKRLQVMAKQASGIAVFGEVPFSALFPDEEGGVDMTTTATFPYAASFHPKFFTNGGAGLFTVEQNHCSHVHIAFIGTVGEYESPSLTATLTVVQESREPTSASATIGSIGSLDADLVPGQSWGVNITGGGNGALVNGYAVCDSAEAF